MTTHNLIRLLAGAMTLLGVALTHFVHPWWLLLPAFVGLNLVQSVFTGFCLPTLLLRRAGWVDAQDVIHWGGDSPAVRRRLQGGLIIGVSVVLGVAAGYYRQCTAGSCPLHPTWWKGALLGAAAGLLLQRLVQARKPRSP